jgi:HEAT repeat protein
VLKDRSVEARLQVAEAMWRLGSEDGLQYLVAAGLSGHPANQMVALLAMAGPRDPRVIEHVRSGLSGDYVEVSLVAARALGMLGSAEAYDLCITNARSNEARQRYLAALALGAIGNPSARDALAPLLKDSDQDVRLAAATAILQLH